MSYKYIIIERSLGEPGQLQRIPIIFPDELPNHMVAEALIPLITMTGTTKVISAGDIEFKVKSCSGKSDTLDLNSDPLDRSLIEMFPLFHGIAWDEEGPAPTGTTKLKDLVGKDSPLAIFNPGFGENEETK